MSSPVVALGPFDVLELIGRGGMGQVWRGLHREEGSEVAIKVITPRRATEGRYVEALRREVEAAAKLNHPAIVRVYDYGVIPYAAQAASFDLFKAESPYLVMEYVRGSSLVGIDRLRWPDIRQVLLECLDALAHAHARKVIHRDIKPGNVLIKAKGSYPRVRITDFGLARALDRSAADRDELNSASGTPSYMAPEQIVGEWRDQGPWTDLYAVGCMAYALIEGRPPFSGESKDEVLRSHIHANIPALRHENVVPDGFEEWLAGMLAKSPEARFRSAADATFALMQFPAEIDGGLGAEPSGHFVAGGPTLATLFDHDSDSFQLEHAPTAALDTRAVDDRVNLNLSMPQAATRLWPRPPLPRSWERNERRMSQHITGVGLGVFGLRSIPMVDRVPQRDIAWEALAEVHQSGQARAVAFQGESGTGKSRLAAWISERAEEVGAATTLRAVHSPVQGPSDGIEPMVATYLRLAGLEQDAVRARIRAWWHVDREPSGDALRASNRLTDFLSSANAIAAPSGGPRIELSDAAERYAVVAQFLERLAAERPVVVWLDDAQWGSDALSFCRWVLERRDPLPVLFLLTVRTDLLASRDREQKLLDEIRSHEATVSVEISPLAENDQTRLVREMLGLEPELTTKVVERTGGNPLFAVQLVGDWVEREVLETTPDGFVLADGVESALPDDIHSLWVRRIEHLVAGIDDSDRDETLFVLQIAAALGQDVAPREWRAVADRASRSIPTDLVSRMVSHRLANRRDDGQWSFAHGMLRDSLERMARAADVHARIHELCAETLGEGRMNAQLAGRVAEHFVLAHAWERAIDPLMEAALGHYDTGDYPTAAEKLGKVEEALAEAGRPEDDAVVGRIAQLRSRIARERGDREEAMRLLDLAQDIADRENDTFLQARVLASRASMAAITGELEKAEEYDLAALERYSDEHDARARAEVYRHLNWVNLWRGKTQKSAQYLEKARELYQSVADLDGLGWVHHELAIIEFEKKRFDEAWELNEKANEFFEQIGSIVALAGTTNLRGEIERYRGELESAESHYRRSLAYYEEVGHLNASIARENLALTQMMQGSHESAREAFVELAEYHETTGYEPALARIYSALLACDSGLADWTVWDRHHGSYIDARPTSEHFDLDIASNLTNGAEFCEEAGEGERARMLYELALEHWRMLENTEQVDSIEERLAVLKSE